MTGKRIDVNEASSITGYDMGHVDDTGGHYSNFWLYDDGILEYDYIPGPDYHLDAKEYVVYQYDSSTGLERHRGILEGCFFTEWT